MTHSALEQAEKDRLHEERMREFYDNADEETRERLVREKIVSIRGGRVFCTPKDFSTYAPESFADGADGADGAIRETEYFNPEDDHEIRKIISSHIRIMMAELLGSKNKPVAIESLSFATGVIYEGDTESQIARRHGITRAAVSKQVKYWQKLFNLPPRASGRKLTTCRKYVKRALAVHLRNDGQFR